MAAMGDLRTVDEARAWLLDHIDHGERCPACTQFAKVYRRKINSAMARKLIGAWRLHGMNWFYMPNLLATLKIHGRDEGALRYWGLLEESDEPRDDGGRAGWWRITGRGVAFVRDELQVPKYARIYDGRCLGFVGDPVGIRDALGARFDYSELMEGK